VQIVRVVWSRGADAVAGVGEIKLDATIAQRSRRLNLFTTISSPQMFKTLLRMPQE